MLRQMGFTPQLPVHRAAERDESGVAAWVRTTQAGRVSLAGTVCRKPDFAVLLDAAMRALIATRLWLTVFRLPPYAPDLNPAEGVWSHLKRSLANLAPFALDGLVAVIRNRLGSTAPFSSPAASASCWSAGGSSRRRWGNTRPSIVCR
ncbi:transposase [Saccharothrix syringae]